MTASVAETLAGRRLLVVLDNCEHVLAAAASLVSAILAASTTVSVIATSREGLRARGEHLWPEPSLDVPSGPQSAAVELFVERGRAVLPGFTLDSDADVDAVTEICRRLDGIALAIELAAARMLSMTPTDLLARLDDRFRLLSGSPHDPDRHQTLRQAVQWSFELLTSDEQTVLGVCSVFAGGFDATAVTAVCDRFDEYTMLDLLDSLVRKSLVTVSRVGGRTRYGLLETIRQFADHQHATSTGAAAGSAVDVGDIDEIRDRHAQYFASEAVAHWETWQGPGNREAADWVEVEFDNLRAGFRWASDRDDLITATAIAAHTAVIAFGRLKREPIGWAEELLPAATAAEPELTQLPRLYTAASLCTFTGRPEDAVSYAQAAVALQTDPRYEPFDNGSASNREAVAHARAGRPERAVEICTALTAQTGRAHVLGLYGLACTLPDLGRFDEAMAIAEDAITAALALGDPSLIASAYSGYGQAFARSDPARALDTLRVGLAYTREHRLTHWEAAIALDTAGLEAFHGNLNQALELYTTGLDSFHRAGDATSMYSVFAFLTWFFAWIKRPEAAATFHGIRSHALDENVNNRATADALRRTLDAEVFDRCVRTGAAMNLTEAVHYAREQINATREIAPRAARTPPVSGT